MTAPEGATRWLTEANAEVLILGDTHLASSMTTLGGGLIANPGALPRETESERAGQALLFDADRGKFVQRPAPGGGTFGVLELPSRRLTVHRASDGVVVDVPRTTVGVRDMRAG